MSLNVEFDTEKNIIKLYDVSAFAVNLSEVPVKYELEEVEDPEFFKYLNMNVLKPINDGEDFIYRFHPEEVLLDDYERKVNFFGRSFGDLFPQTKDFYYPIFRRVLKTHKPEKITGTIYEDEKVLVHVSLDVLFKDGDIWLSSIDYTKELAQNVELDRLQVAYKYVQKASKTAIHYVDPHGKYHWTEEVYNLIEREPRIDDENYQIFKELLDEEDRKDVTEKLENLAPGESLGETVYKITLENGKEKYIQVNTHDLIDDEGNFIQRNGYTKDITDDYQRLEDLNVLTSTFEDVQKAALISVSYIDKEGKYHWTPQTYQLIDREPREGDEDYDIVLALADEDTQCEINRITDELPLNEFLGAHIFSITTESGEKKYLQRDVHKIPDRNGNYLRTSRYTQEITDDYYKNQQLISLNSVVQDVEGAASIAIYYRDPEGKYHYTDEIYNIIEREPRLEDVDTHVLRELMTEEDLIDFDQRVSKLKSGEFFDTDERWPITLESGKVKYLKGNIRDVYDDEGNFIRRSEYAQDVTAQVNYENELIQADKDKTVLVQEVHHRVKNNLQLITSFIHLEKKWHKDDPERILEITENRLNSLALIHERIYSEDNMSYIEIKPFFIDFDKQLYTLSSQDDIKFKGDFDNGLKLSIDVVTPLALMINELTTNTFKYAFREGFSGDKEIFKSFHVRDENGSKTCEFVYKDNGLGLPDDFDIDTTPSLGWTIIRALVGQLDGEFELFNDNGLNFVFKFPLK